MKQLNKLLLSMLVLLTTSLTAFAEENITFYHYDLLGSPVATTNEMGEVVWKESYGAWGEKLLNEDATEDNVRGYTGHVNDAETGLTYMQARYYDPQIGRFMGIDPVGFKEDNPIMFNRFAYANNNPYKYTDPNGENPFSAFRVGTAIGSTLNSAAYHTMGVTLSMMLSQAAWEALHNEEVDVDKLSDAGREADSAAKNGKWSKAGRSLDKKTSRGKSVFGAPLSGNEENKNKKGQDILDDLLTDPESTTEVNGRNQVTVTGPDGRAARWNTDGSFQGFREPENTEDEVSTD